MGHLRPALGLASVIVVAGQNEMRRPSWIMRGEPTLSKIWPKDEGSLTKVSGSPIRTRLNMLIASIRISKLAPSVILNGARLLTLEVWRRGGDSNPRFAGAIYSHIPRRTKPA
jgi:hypothetical protein